MSTVHSENFMPASSTSKLKRPVYVMPEFIESALHDSGLRVKYDARPAYQRNDYIGWITRAKLEATRQKRLNQMLSELRAGTKYMNMSYKVQAVPATSRSQTEA
jgi:uncharacterized protein YdeI (YjbR/CyaY-like superfamily)